MGRKLVRVPEHQLARALLIVREQPVYKRLQGVYRNAAAASNRHTRNHALVNQFIASSSPRNELALPYGQVGGGCQKSTCSSIAMGLTEFRVVEIRWGRAPTFTPAGVWSCERLRYTWDVLTRVPFWLGP